MSSPLDEEDLLHFLKYYTNLFKHRVSIVNDTITILCLSLILHNRLEVIDSIWEKKIGDRFYCRFFTSLANFCFYTIV